MLFDSVGFTCDIDVKLASVMLAIPSFDGGLTRCRRGV